jgi:hypothetical protein
MEKGGLNMSEAKMNMGTIDRFARVIAGSFLFLLATYALDTVLATIVVIISLALMLEGLSGWCPLYALLNFSTKK